MLGRVDAAWASRKVCREKHHGNINNYDEKQNSRRPVKGLASMGGCGQHVSQCCAKDEEKSCCAENSRVCPHAIIRPLPQLGRWRRVIGHRQCTETFIRNDAGTRQVPLTML